MRSISKRRPLPTAVQLPELRPRRAGGVDWRKLIRPRFDYWRIIRCQTVVQAAIQCQHLSVVKIGKSGTTTWPALIREPETSTLLLRLR